MRAVPSTPATAVPAARFASSMHRSPHVMEGLFMSSTETQWSTRLTRGGVNIGAAFGLATLLVAGLAWATIPDAGGTIHACYSRSGGTLRVIDATVTTRYGGSFHVTHRNSVEYASHERRSEHRRGIRSRIGGPHRSRVGKHCRCVRCHPRLLQPFRRHASRHRCIGHHT